MNRVSYLAVAVLAIAVLFSLVILGQAKEKIDRERAFRAAVIDHLGKNDDGIARNEQAIDKSRDAIAQLQCEAENNGTCPLYFGTSQDWRSSYAG